VSYEGWEQRLCENGHRTVYDCYDAPEENGWRCPHCRGRMAWRNNVDETNGGSVGMVRLKMLHPEVPAIYQIPEPQPKGGEK